MTGLRDEGDRYNTDWKIGTDCHIARPERLRDEGDRYNTNRKIGTECHIIARTPSRESRGRQDNYFK